MLIKLDDPRLLAEVRAVFEARPDCVVEQVGETKLRLSLLGSFGVEQHRAEIERLLQAVAARADAIAARSGPDPSLATELRRLLRHSRLRVLDGGASPNRD
jgi:hypothetical protein